MLLWAAGCAWRPGLWLWALPAALPVASLAPWTGWVVLDEFDLLLLATLAGGYGRVALLGPGPARLPPAAPFAGPLLAAVALSSLLALYRGLADAGWVFGWFQAHADPLNSLRVFKGPAFALALWPLLRVQLAADTPLALQRLCLGMLAGLALVSLAVLWERAAFPGLWDFTARYRTSAAFWEMHVGGAAIDAYLALAVPFVAWALWRARRPLPWLAAALLALAAAYACLTTFSRGVYLAVGASLLLLGAWLLVRRVGFRSALLLRRAAFVSAAVLLAGTVLLLALLQWGGAGVLGMLLLLTALLAAARRRLPGWRGVSVAGLSLLLVLEVVAVFGSGSFMLSRWDDSDRDAGGRLGHWRNGIGLLVTPDEWAWGLGLGRLPDSYARFVAEREFPGAARQVQTVQQRSALRLYGPRRQAELGGLFAVTQRVPLQPGVRYRASFDLRVPSPVDISMGVCEMHLIYERECQWARLRARPGPVSWQRHELAFDGPLLDPGWWFAPRMGVFVLTVHTAGGMAEFDDIVLTGAGQGNLLRNGGFERGLAHWLPAAQYYYLPWHIDNLVLEWLIERGVLGLLLMLALSGLALWNLGFGPARRQLLAPFLAASLCGGLMVGLVSSVMDVPRVASLFFLLIGVALALGDGVRSVDSHGSPQGPAGA